MPKLEKERAARIVLKGFELAKTILKVLLVLGTLFIIGLYTYTFPTEAMVGGTILLGLAILVGLPCLYIWAKNTVKIAAHEERLAQYRDTYGEDAEPDETYSGWMHDLDKYDEELYCWDKAPSGRRR